MDICFKQVGKRFGRKVVLQAIDWHIGDDETWQIDGPSGIGKTTLLRLLMGLEKPTSGQILGTNGLRFAAVFQENRLLPTLTAVDNVRLVSDWPIAQIERLLQELLHLNDLAQPVSELSGGMQRRVAIARALAAASDILVFDEPFSGLDEQNILQAIHCIQRYREGRTLILSSHIPIARFMELKHLHLQ